MESKLGIRLMTKEQYLSSIGIKTWRLRQSEDICILPFFRGSQLVGALILDDSSLVEKSDTKSFSLVEAILKSLKCQLNCQINDHNMLENLASFQLIVTLGDKAKQYAESRKINNFIALADPKHLLSNPLEKRAIWKLLKMDSKLKEFI